MLLGRGFGICGDIDLNIIDLRNIQVRLTGNIFLILTMEGGRLMNSSVRVSSVKILLVHGAAVA